MWTDPLSLNAALASLVGRQGLAVLFALSGLASLQVSVLDIALFFRGELHSDESDRVSGPVSGPIVALNLGERPKLVLQSLRGVALASAAYALLGQAYGLAVSDAPV